MENAVFGNDAKMFVHFQMIFYVSSLDHFWNKGDEKEFKFFPHFAFNISFFCKVIVQQCNYVHQWNKYVSEFLKLEYLQ